MEPTAKKGHAHPAVSSASARKSLPGDLAAEKVFACLPREAPCIGILGKTGTGKTEAARALIPHYLRRSRGIVAVIDDKEPRARYQGQFYVQPEDTGAKPPEPSPRVIVFRGVPAQMVTVDHEKAARWQQRLASSGVPSLMVHDEQADAAKYGQWLAGGDSLLKMQYVKGRALGVGKLWLTQLPEYVPDEPWRQSTHILCFNVDESTLARLKKHKWVDQRLAATIAALPDRRVPEHQRGYFVLLEPDCASDGHVYRFERAR